MRLPRLPSAAVLALSAAALGAAPCVAGAGTAEVFLDKGAVAAVVAANFPPGAQVAVPGLGPVTLRFVPPEKVEFIDGAVEARIGLRVAETGLGGSGLFRFLPEVTEKGGVVRLRTIRVVADGTFGLVPNLAALVPPIDLQGAFDWNVDNRGGGQTAFGLRVTAVRVRDNRLEIRLGLTTVPAATRRAATGGATASGSADSKRAP